MKYFEVVPFGFELSPQAIATADRSLSNEAFEADRRGKHSRRQQRRPSSPKGRE